MARTTLTQEGSFTRKTRTLLNTMLTELYAGVSSSPTVTGGTLTGSTLTGPIYSDQKILAAQADYSATVTPATITGFSWTVVPGTYVFEVNLPTIMTTVGGLTVAFAYTSATITAIQYQWYASTAVDNTLAVSGQGTTTTTATKIFDSKTSAYTLVNIKGSMTVSVAGTFVFTGCQNTSAATTDASAIRAGAYAWLRRSS
jgi:hypothetical protein